MFILFLSSLLSYTSISFSNIIGFTNVILGADSSDGFVDLLPEFEFSKKEEQFKPTYKSVNVFDVSDSELYILEGRFKKIIQQLMELENILKIMKGCMEREIVFYKRKMEENKDIRNGRNRTLRTALDLKLNALLARGDYIHKANGLLIKIKTLKFYNFRDEEELKKQ
ncbi:hypothetical protein EHP00_1450 [Ecytonucleospora hepatopenaei]|uniref:Uncharacterized protein n=1 Tax=Ecytonucleospora hepatopenaei TaxID=646526 RepID=A0A1W0E7F0_9MICR|nr:hypothetical protein EHP00_1450 [Ecytonucleospora hepatopenaei]